MEKHKFFVEVASEVRPDGGTSVSSDNQFYVTVECTNVDAGKRQLLAQYGGEPRVRVVWYGRA